MNDLKETPVEERPYERAVLYGTAALTDAELLAVLLRTGTSGFDVMALSHAVLNLDGKNNGITGLLHHTYEEYLDCPGIGKVKAVQLLCLGEISKRIWKRDASSRRVSFHEPSACARYYMQEMRHLEKEELVVSYLDTRYHLTGDEVISLGTVDSSVCSVRDIMISALNHRAVSIILVHNHPSGNPSPSREDINVTKQVEEAGKMIGIHLSDHIIIGDNAYYSFREWGTL